MKWLFKFMFTAIFFGLLAYGIFYLYQNIDFSQYFNNNRNQGIVQERFDNRLADSVLAKMDEDTVRLEKKIERTSSQLVKIDILIYFFVVVIFLQLILTIFVIRILRKLKAPIKEESETVEH